MPVVTTPSDKPKRLPVAPVINEEADRALFAILLRYGMTAFAVAIFAMVGCGLLYSRYPHDRLLQPYGPVFYATALLWLVPFYIGQHKQSNLRLKFARQYAEEGRWKEAAAALGSFDEFGQKSLDRTGEAHYLLAQARDKLGRKDQAESARQFVVKHRAGSPWALKLAGAAGRSISPSASELRRKTSEPENRLADRGLKKAAPSGGKGKRRRF